MHIEEIEPPDQTGITWWAQPQSTDRATLELELGPALRHTVGTELGLFDYSLALDAGWQVAWAGMPGWFAQGNYTHPWAHSSDFGPKGAFGSMRIKPGSQQSLISHVWQPTPQTYTQANIGYINREARGILLQGAWLDADRRLKFSTQAGRFVDDTPGHAAHAPLLVKARYDWVPMQWAMEVTRGRYMAGDVGWQLSSLHQFSRHRLEFYMRQSESPSMPLNRFAGFIIAIPIGPDRAWTPGPVSLRGRDLWGIGLQSKIGHNNTISTGYGEEPFVRHGLNDILDQDRRAPLGSAPAAERLNQALQTP
jgi:hypothetical protein